MWNLPKGKEFLQDISLREIEERYKVEQKAKPKLRLLAAVYRKRGESIDDIAQKLNVSRNTVHGWLHRFIHRGIQAKDSIKQTGKPPMLSISQRKQLLRELERGPPNNKMGLWTTKAVRELIHKKFKVTFVPQHVWRILTASGLSLHRPRKRHYKSASPDEKVEFKKKRGDTSGTMVQGVLLWAQKMRQHSILSQ